MTLISQATLVVKSLDGKVAWVLNHQIFNERAYLAQSFRVYSGRPLSNTKGEVEGP